MMIPPSIAAFFGKWGVGLFLGVLLLSVDFYAGKLHERAGWESRRVKQVQTARKTERDGAAIANKAEADHQDKVKQQEGKANAELPALRNALPSVPDCRVPRRVIRLLDGQRMPAAPGSAAQPQAKAPAMEAGTGDDKLADTVECRVVIDHCAVNRLTVCEPNAQQLEDLQQFYENLKRRYNTPP